MQDLKDADNPAAHAPPAAAEAGVSAGAGLTLVVQPRGGTVATPSAIALSLRGPEPRVAQSFPEACSVLLSERVALILLVDDPSARFSESELDVIGKLAGQASIVLVRPWTALGTRKRDGVPSATEYGWGTGQPHSLTIGALHYDPVVGGFKANGRMLKLSQAETDLLLDIISAPGHCIAGRDLVNGGGVTGERRSDGVVRQFVYRIRRKLADAGDPAFLMVSRGGYRLLSPSGQDGRSDQRSWASTSSAVVPSPARAETERQHGAPAVTLRSSEKVAAGPPVPPEQPHG